MMNRRHFVGTLVSAAAGGLLPGALLTRSAVAQAPRQVVVIGAGIVGCSIAWHLARRGCDVTILESREPAAQASGNSFAWLNGGDAAQPLSYHVLRAYAIGEHRRIAGELDWPVRWGGSLEWHESGNDELARNVRVMQSRGTAMRLVRPDELRAIEPGIAVARGTPLAYAEQDGALDPAGATRLLFDSARELGVQAVVPARVTGIEADRGRQRVLTNVGSFDADSVVVAAGVGASAIAKMAGLTLTQNSTPGVIAISEPMQRVVNTVLYGPAVHVHQRSDGRVVFGEKGGPPDAEEHRALLADRPNRFPTAELATEHATRILDAARKIMPGLAGATFGQVGVGWRPMPADGLPVLGRPRSAPGLYFAVMHSGITLAPLVGRLVSTELLDGVELDVLSDFRFDRPTLR